jgi:hypothetical protein
MFEYEPTLPGGPRERNIVSASPDRSAVNDDLEGGPTLPPALGRALNQDNKKTPHKTRKDPVLAVKGRVSKEIYQPRFTPQTLVGGFCRRNSRRGTTTQGLPSVTDAIAWHFAPG